MRRAMQLTIRITTEDGVPGHPTRFAQVFPKIGKLLSDGARGGEFEERFVWAVGGDANSENATVTFDVMPVTPSDRS